MVSLASFADELEKLGAPSEPNQPSFLRRLLPAVLGTAAGLGAFKYLRKVRLSSHPGLAAIQQKAKGSLTHLDELPDERMPGAVRRLGQRFVRGVDRVINEPASVVAARNKLPISELAKQRVKKVEGAVLPMGGPRQAAAYRGDLDLNPKPKSGVRLENKLREARLLNHLPGGAPKSESLASHVRSKGSATEGSLDDLQRRLAQKYPAGYIVKPIDDAASGGVPSHKDRFASILSTGDGTEHQGWMRDMMKRPNRYMVQEYIPIQSSRRMMSYPPRTGSTERSLSIGAKVPDEWRVHVARGQVVPGSTMHRWTYDAGMSPSSRREIVEVEKFMQENLNKMPRDARGVPMAADVVRTTDGKLKILELNSGGQSGFLLSPALRGKAWKYYKGITGRASQPEALVKGLGAGAAATLATSKAMSLDKKSERELA